MKYSLNMTQFLNDRETINHYIWRIQMKKLIETREQQLYHQIAAMNRLSTRQFKNDLNRLDAQLRGLQAKDLETLRSTYKEV